MSIQTVAAFAGKELREGPRGILFVWVILFPILITFIMRLIFGGLLSPLPRLGIVDAGSSTVAEKAFSGEAIETFAVADEQTLRSRLATHDLDAGLVLPAGFDDALLAGERPELQLLFSGQSAADAQLVVSVALIDIVREITGQAAAVLVDQQLVGGGSAVPLEQRIVPLLVLVAVAFAGVFLPAASILQEKEARTLSAALVTPARVGEIMLAKGITGFLLSFGVGALTLVINGGFTAGVAALLVVIALASLMCVVIGIIIGAAVNSIATMFSIWKVGGILLFAPAILFLFPGVPEWISWFFPTYYFLGPLYEMITEGALLGEVWMRLSLSAALSLLLVGVAVPVCRRMELQLAAS